MSLAIIPLPYKKFSPEYFHHIFILSVKTVNMEKSRNTKHRPKFFIGLDYCFHQTSFVLVLMSYFLTALGLVLGLLLPLLLSAYIWPPLVFFCCGQTH